MSAQSHIVYVKLQIRKICICHLSFSLLGLSVFFQIA